MEIQERNMRRMLWEARTITSDPHHPINDRRHPKHLQAVAALKLIEEEGRRLLGERPPQRDKSRQLPQGA